MVVEFELDGTQFMALNGFEDAAAATPAKIALFVDCENQTEVDALWDNLSEGGEKGQCGWLTDEYGISWNIVPAGLSDVFGGPDPVKSQRAMQAMLQMKKLDIDALRRAYEGE